MLLISLDHDLPLRRDANGALIDCGNGRNVVDYLSSRDPTCPVIVHSSNAACADGMMFALTDGGWPCVRVYPRDDVSWVRDAWAEEIRSLITRGWLRR